jgi:hypothetical protein
MTIERIQEFYNVQPFRPFVIHLADGRNIEVAHRDFIMRAPNGRTVAVMEPDNSMHVIDLLLVTDLECASATNGRRRKGK